MGEAAPCGILAIWCDPAPGRASDLDAWFQDEHLAERLAVPGFRIGRRYEAISGNRRFFNYYETDTPPVLASATYLERVNNPTPWTRTIMSEVFRNMVRTACACVYRRGDYRAPFAVIARFEAAQDERALRAVIEATAAQPGFACGEVWIAAEIGAPANEEEELRGGDDKIAACILIETLRQADAERVSGALAERFKSGAEIGVFRLLCERRATQ